LKHMRTERILESLEEAGLDAYMVTREPNVFYFTGTISGGALLLSQGTEPTLLAPSLNISIARDQAKGCEVKPYERNTLLDRVKEAWKGAEFETIGFDEMALNLHKDLREAFPGTELKEAQELVWRMRRVKDEGELKLIARACELADMGMQAIREKLREGVREYELAAEAAYTMMRNGAEGYAFDFIVASGPRSAYPHSGVTDRKIKRGDLVTVDMGATYMGYRSDLTRTFVLGPPTEKQAEIYETVLEANEAAFPEMKAGAKGGDVDGVARRIIEDAGYGEYFIHSLGHGVGLEVHEPPSLRKDGEDVLEAGNVVSNEPGVYIHGYGGVRTEDTVLVSGGGPVSLTRFPKGLESVRV